MEVHRQRCQNCESIDVRNILVRDLNQPTHVFVRCSTCKELVARYTLSDYYHHGKGLESYLRAQGATGGDSARQWLSEFEQTQRDSLEGYERALAHLAEAKKDV